MRNNQLKSVMALVVSMLTVGVLTIGTASAQFTIGIKAGANASNYSQVTDRKFGLEAGIFMRLGNGFFFQPEVNYSFKSSTIKDAIQEATDNWQLKQHFISVPALLGYHFVNNDNFKFRLTLGPRFDFKIADNLEGSGWQTNTVQWGGQVGAGIDFWRFALDFSYCISADNFRNTDQGESQRKAANLFILSLGFKFIK